MVDGSWIRGSPSNARAALQVEKSPARSMTRVAIFRLDWNRRVFITPMAELLDLRAAAGNLPDGAWIRSGNIIFYTNFVEQRFCIEYRSHFIDHLRSAAWNNCIAS